MSKVCYTIGKWDPVQFYSRLAHKPPPWLHSRASSTLVARGAQRPLRWQQTHFHGAQAGCRDGPCMVSIGRANGSRQGRRSAPRQHPRRCLRQEEIADAKSCKADRFARRRASFGRQSAEAIVAEGCMAMSAQPKPTLTCRRIGGRSLLEPRHSRAFSQQIMWGKGSKRREFSIFGVVERPRDRRKGRIALIHHLDDCPSVGYTLQRAIRPSKQQTKMDKHASDVGPDAHETDATAAISGLGAPVTVAARGLAEGWPRQRQSRRQRRRQRPLWPPSGLTLCRTRARHARRRRTRCGRRSRCYGRHGRSRCSCRCR